MKIPVTLNGSKLIFDAEPSQSLLSVLREEGFYSVKCGCTRGICGSCTVLLNGKPVPSCTIPVGTIRDNEIVTLEHFKSTEDYAVIMQGLAQAGVHLCGYCNAGKILTAYDLLRSTSSPEAKDIYAAIEDLNCCCTDTSSLAKGILNAFAIKDSDLNGKGL